MKEYLHYFPYKAKGSAKFITHDSPFMLTFMPLDTYNNLGVNQVSDSL